MLISHSLIYLLIKLTGILTGMARGAIHQLLRRKLTSQSTVRILRPFLISFVICLCFTSITTYPILVDLPTLTLVCQMIENIDLCTLFVKKNIWTFLMYNLFSRIKKFLVVFIWSVIRVDAILNLFALLFSSVIHFCSSLTVITCVFYY